MTETETKITLGPYATKIHQEELIELIDLWEFAPGVKEEIVGLIRSRADELKGPHLFRYYNPKPSRVASQMGHTGEFVRSGDKPGQKAQSNMSGGQGIGAGRPVWQHPLQ